MAEPFARPVVAPPRRILRPSFAPAPTSSASKPRSGAIGGRSSGLTAADFELLDNGVAQEITDVNYEKLPIDVTVLLDVSASVTGSVLDELRRSLRQLRTDLGARDRLRLVTFDMRVRRLVDFTDPAAATDTALASLGAAGSSAVFDSLAVALTRSRRRPAAGS